LEHIYDCDYRKPDALLPLKAKVGNAKIIDEIPSTVWDNSMT